MVETIKKNLPRHFVGILSVVLSGYFISIKSADPFIFLASVFFMVICIMDTLKSKIPNFACLLMIIGAFFYHFITAGTHGVLTALLGLFTGFGLFIVPYCMGGMGAGDVKALASIGALLGPTGTFHVFLYTCLIGGVIALLQIVMDGHLLQKWIAWKNALLVLLGTGKFQHVIPDNFSEKLKFPYASAMAFGYFSFISWGGMIS